MFELKPLCTLPIRYSVFPIVALFQVCTEDEVPVNLEGPSLPSILLRLENIQQKLLDLTGRQLIQVRGQLVPAADPQLILHGVDDPPATERDAGLGHPGRGAQPPWMRAGAVGTSRTH